MLPVFLLAVGADAELTFFPSATHSGIKGLRPRTTVAKRLATMCVLPLLLAGVLGGPRKHEQLVEYLRKLLVEGVANQSPKCNAEIVDAVRFLCTFEDHYSMIFNLLCEMVVSSNIDMKINAANLLKVIMDAFLEDGSHEAAIAVVRALVVAVPHTTDRLKDYLLSKIFQLTATPPSSDLVRRRERANAFCEAIRALDATGHDTCPLLGNTV